MDMRTPLSTRTMLRKYNLQDRIMGLEEALGSWRVVKWLFLREPDADVGDVAVVLGLYHSSIGKGEQEPSGRKQRHVGGIDVFSCQHLQVLMTQWLQKHWREAGGQEEERVARQRETTCDVRRQCGHQNGI